MASKKNRWDRPTADSNADPASPSTLPRPRPTPTATPDTADPGNIFQNSRPSGPHAHVDGRARPSASGQASTSATPPSSRLFQVEMQEAMLPTPAPVAAPASSSEDPGALKPATPEPDLDLDLDLDLEPTSAFASSATASGDEYYASHSSEPQDRLPSTSSDISLPQEAVVSTGEPSGASILPAAQQQQAAPALNEIDSLVMHAGGDTVLAGAWTHTHSYGRRAMPGADTVRGPPPPLQLDPSRLPQPGDRATSTQGRSIDARAGSATPDDLSTCSRSSTLSISNEEAPQSSRITPPPTQGEKKTKRNQDGKK